MQPKFVTRMAINDIKKVGGHGGWPNKSKILYPYLLPLMQSFVGGTIIRLLGLEHNRKGSVHTTTLQSSCFALRITK